MSSANYEAWVTPWSTTTKFLTILTICAIIYCTCYYYRKYHHYYNEDDYENDGKERTKIRHESGI